MGGDLPMKEIWYFAFVCISILTFVLIPFAIFFYETDEDATCTSRICSAI